MVDSTKQSDQILAAAGKSLAVQRSGGTHRPGESIGKGSAGLKFQSMLKRAGYFGAAVLAIFIAMSVIGGIIGGIGFWGIVSAFFAVVMAGVFFANYPKVKIPKRTELKQGEPKQMVARTELWLEAQRPALPAPAIKVVDQIGVQLDALGLQLETVDQSHPSVAEVRELVGEYIPETIDNYRKIPAHLRAEQHVGKSADDRLADSLGKISGEIDRVTRRLAEGALDDLAIKDRYLEYRYGGDEALSDTSKSDKGA